jgi:undecaprenyl-diphosphatase
VLALEWPSLAPALGLLAGGIGASRVILGLHYVSDVAAGALLGLVIGGAVGGLLLR